MGSPYYTLHLPNWSASNALCDGRAELELKVPLVMGILNVTPDSFYAGSRCDDELKVRQRVRQMLADGAAIIDIGACSTRPGAEVVDADEEYRRLREGMKAVRSEAPDAIVSVDTFRADVAAKCVEQLGVNMINDVGGGTLDKDMFKTVARLQVPYVLMHMRGTPATMQQPKYTKYSDVTAEVVAYLAQKIDELRQMGFDNVISDPGFGFSKTVEHNYEMLQNLGQFHNLDVPLLVGISRKSMICKVLGCVPADALNGTTVINTTALERGAHILRVHDVKQACEAVKLVRATIKESKYFKKSNT